MDGYHIYGSGSHEAPHGSVHLDGRPQFSANPYWVGPCLVCYGYQTTANGWATKIELDAGEVCILLDYGTPESFGSYAVGNGTTEELAAAIAERRRARIARGKVWTSLKEICEGLDGPNYRWIRRTGDRASAHDRYRVYDDAPLGVLEERLVDATRELSQRIRIRG